MEKMLSCEVHFVRCAMQRNTTQQNETPNRAPAETVFFVLVAETRAYLKLDFGYCGHI